MCKEMEDRITSGLELQLKANLQLLENAGDVTAEVDAQKEIAKLGYEEARLS